MTRLKKDQIGIKKLSSVTGKYERPVYKKIRLNFNETISSPLAPRCRHRSALRHVLVKRSSCGCFLHHDFDSESSLQRNVTNSVGRRSESKERRTEARFPQTASVTRLRREDDPLAHCPSSSLVTSLATSRLRRISEAIRKGN